jgi:hypothetical protein
MKIKIDELIGIELNWAVATAMGASIHPLLPSYPNICLYKFPNGSIQTFNPCNDWREGGPIIEQEQICLEYNWFPKGWEARDNRIGYARGKTPLEAAMRCYVKAHLGIGSDEIELPNELNGKEFV